MTRGPDFCRNVVKPDDVLHPLPPDVDPLCARCGRPHGRYVSGFPPHDGRHCFRWFPDEYPGDTPLGTGRTARDFAEHAARSCRLASAAAFASMSAAADARLVDLSRAPPEALEWALARAHWRRYRDGAQVEFHLDGVEGSSATARLRVGFAVMPRRWRSDGAAAARRVRCVCGGDLMWEVDLSADSASYSASYSPKLTVTPATSPISALRWPDVRAGDVLEVDVTFTSTGEWRGTLLGESRDT